MVDSGQGAADPQKQAIEAMTASVLSNNEEEAAYQGLSLLLRLVGNIAKNPTEDKFRRFKKTNAKIASTILALQGGINDLIVAIGFVSQPEQYELAADGMNALKKGNRVIQTAIEPMRVARMTPEDREKHLFIEADKKKFQVEKAKRDAIRAEQLRLQKADRQEKSTEEVVASVGNKLNFGANLVQFKPPAGGG